jgi:hypothetical protein
VSDFDNLGKFAWEVVTSNRPKVNATADFVNAIPKGVEWADLSAPAGTNYRNWDWRGPGLVLKDFNFSMQLSWTYGARYRGGGAYITNASVTVLDHSIGLGGYEINISCRVGNIENAGSERAPVPRIPMDVSISWTNWFSGGGGTNRFEIWGNGPISARYDDESYEP